MSMLLERVNDGSIARGFVGRQKLLKEIYKKIDDREPAVVLKGPGGSGKTALLGQLALYLKKRQYSFILIEGKILPELVLKKIFRKAQKKGIREAEEIYSKGTGQDLREKILWFVENYLKKEKVILIFEDFETNLNLDGKFQNERLKEFLMYLKDSLKDNDTLLFFTTEKDIPGFHSINITDFTEEEFKKLLSYSQALNRLGEKSRKRMFFDIGSNPRALQLLDHIAVQELGEKNFDWDTLKNRVDGLAERILYKETEEADFSPLLLKKILDYLNESQVELLKVLSLFNRSIGREILAALGLRTTEKDRKRLLELSLIEFSEKSHLYQVHPLTARFYWGKMGEAQRKQLNLRAAHYFENIRDEKNEKDIEHEIEARRCYLEAEEWDRAAALTFDLDQYLTAHGYIQLAYDLLKEIENREYNQENQLRLYQRLGFMEALFAKFDNVIAQNEKLLVIYQEIGDRRAMAHSLSQLGLAYENKRKYDDALKNYDKAVEIFREIGDTPAAVLNLLQMGKIQQNRGKYDEALTKFQEALSRAEAGDDQGGISESLHHLGRIHEQKGELDEALKNYQQSQQIKVILDDKKGMAAGLHQMGNIYFLKGEFDTALDHYHQSVQFSEQSSDLRSAGNSLGQMGLIHQRRGEDEKALKLFEKSLGYFQELEDQPGIASSMHQLGRISQDKGKLDEALDYYKKSLEIREKHSDMQGMGTGYGQLGMLYFDKGEYQEALRSSIKACMIFNQLGAPQAQLAQKNIQKVKEKLPQQEFFDILKEFNITPVEEEKKEI